MCFESNNQIQSGFGVLGVGADEKRNTTMKKLLLIIALICVSGIVKSQDVIVKKDKSEIQALVIRVDDENIEYKKWNNQSGPTFVVSVSKVSLIRYNNGDIDRFDDIPSETQQTAVTPKSTNNTSEITEAVIRSELVNQEAKLHRTITVGSLVTTISAIGGGLAVAIPSGSWLAGAGVGVGVTLIGAFIINEVAKPYKNAVAELKKQLEMKNLSLLPVILKSDFNDQNYLGVELSFQF